MSKSDSILRFDPESGKRHQTVGEEIANAVSHGVGFVAALAILPFLIRRGAEARGTAGVVFKLAKGGTAYPVASTVLYPRSMAGV